ncbi:MAG TPA: hypothetical protein VFR03_04955 [Thermoanaerobaculia bacterium]|nr:hypothetical protein [Thermoanaerobaculia bacterium]
MTRRAFLPLLLAALPVLGGCGNAPKAQPSAAPAKQAPAGPRLGIELQRGRDPREMVWIGTRSVIIGPLSGPLVRKFFVDPRRPDMVWYFLRTYAPFERKGMEWNVSFHGQGKVKAGPTEQRMILEWARQTAAEIANGQGGTAYGLALAWHQGSSSLDCQDVAVYLTGEAVASSCAWDGEVRGWLEPGALARLYAWFDHLAPFQGGGGQTQESLRPGALETRLVFAGKGINPATAGEQSEIQSFGASLFAELAGRRNGAAPPPPPPVAVGGKPAAPAPVPAVTPPAHLLLPPGALNPRQEEMVLQLPEKAPAPPEPSSPRPSSPVPSHPPAPGEEGETPPGFLGRVVPLSR